MCCGAIPRSESGRDVDSQDQHQCEMKKDWYERRGMRQAPRIALSKDHGLYLAEDAGKGDAEG